MFEKKRIVAWILAIMMVIQILPVNALAEGVWRVAGQSNEDLHDTYSIVRFYVDDDTMIAEQHVASGTDPVYPQDPTKEGYEFDGW